MAYLEDQTASTLQSVVDQIADFAETNAGFTKLTDLEPAGADTTMKVLLKGGMYYYFYGGTEDLGSFTPNKTVGMIYSRMMKVAPTLLNYLSTGINAMQYRSKMQTFENQTGPYEGLNMYTDGNAVHVVLEVYSNVFAHMSFGICTKFATWTGGEFITSNNPSSGSSNSYFKGGTSNSYSFDGGYASPASDATGINAIYRPKPSGTTGLWSDWAHFSNTNYSTSGQHAKSSGWSLVTPGDDSTYKFTSSLFIVSPNDTSLRTLLIPIYIRISREEESSQYHLQGHVPTVKYCNIRDLDPKELSDVNWRIYPYSSKFGAVTVSPRTTDQGLAYDRS
jgi:hypothetical protein